MILTRFLSSPVCFRISEYDTTLLVLFSKGCDSGFGKAACERLAKKGFHVFAGCLKASGVQFDNEKVHVLQMDVTKPIEILNACNEVSIFLLKNPAYKLGGVVANAGVALGLEAELLPDEKLEQIIEVNFYGAISVFKQFLPLIRRRRKENAGRLVAMSSMAAHISGAGLAAYSASKAGLLQWADCFRFEVSKFGINVSVICPDFYTTDMVANFDYNYQRVIDALNKSDTSVIEDYGGIEVLKSNYKKGLKNLPLFANSDITPVLESIDDALFSTKPLPMYTPISFLSRFLWFINLYWQSAFIFIFSIGQRLANS